MNREKPPEYDSVIARAVNDYLVTGRKAVLKALSPDERAEAERQIAARRKAARRARRRSGPRYVRQFVYIIIGFIILLFCFYGVYAFPKMA